MKINFYRILSDHFGTLRDANTGRWSLADLFIFFIAPLLLSTGVYYKLFEFKADFYNVSITFFGIFIALLLNIQVGIFSIFLRSWEKPSDNRSASLVLEKLQERKLVLKELNSNVSYLIIVSCISLLFFIVVFAFSMINVLNSAISVFLYAHFMLTLIMVVKRSYALFQGEYAN